MQTLELANPALVEQIKALNELLEEVKDNQSEELKLLQKNHTTNMQKLDKLHEYNKIADMTNQIFEKRLLEIEKAIKEISKNVGA
ncbi:MAG: hypothetical protein IKD76_06430 [Clostridia bacterium]|nr:hypothetical protein [Clostridia bacterium]